MIIILTVSLVLIGIFSFWRFYYFLRNPEREIPNGDNDIVSPADGYVCYIKRIHDGEVPIAVKGKTKIRLTEFLALDELKETTGYLIGIFMTPLSVHHNRIPVPGTVIYKNHTDAPKNFSMGRMSTNVYLNHQPFDKDSEFIIKNERLTIGIQTRTSHIITVTQIADSYVNRIVARVNVGDEVSRGDRYGLIRFGSQVDIFIPESLFDKAQVSVRDYVHGGSTVLATATKPLE